MTSNKLFLASCVVRPSILRSLRGLLALSSVSLLAASSGCAGNDDDEDEDDSSAAEMALDASDSGEAESALLAASIEGVVLGQVAGSPVEISTAISARLSARFSPAGCATSSPNGSSLTVTFDNCIGPRGLRQVDGTLTLGVTSVTASSVALSATATDFQIGGATLDIDLDATYSLEGGAAKLAVESNSSGVGPFGHQLEHTGSYEATWTATCTSIEGAWSTTRDGRARSIEVDVQRCVDSCAAGTIVRTTRDGREITVTLDGSVAVWASSTGRNGSFALRCGR